MANNERFFIDDLARQQALSKRSDSMDAYVAKLMFAQHAGTMRANTPGITDDQIRAELQKGRYATERAQYMNTVAPVYKDQVSDFVRLSQNSTILGSKDSFYSAPKYKEPENIVDTYQRMGKAGLFQGLHTLNATGKVQTGASLIQNAIMFNEMNYNYTKIRNNSTFGAMEAAYNYFNSQNQFMAFDLETLGGTNEHGYKSFDTITEFSFKTFDKANPGVAASTIENVIGLTNEQADSYLQELATIESDGARTGRMQVLGGRFGKYGHSDTKIDRIAAGQWKVSAFAGDGAEGLHSMDTIRRGIERLREVGIEQQANRAGNGLMGWQNQMAEAVNLLNRSQMSIVGYNDITADIPWMNQFLPKMLGNMPAQDKAAFLVNAGFQPGSIPSINIASNRHIDLRTFANLAGEAVGKGSYYIGRDKLDILSKGFTQFQQEALGRLFFKEEFDKQGLAAHAAGFDVDILSRLVSQKVEPGKSVLDIMFGDAKKGASKIGGKLRAGSRDLLLANMAQSYRPGGNDPLSFVHDNLDNTFRTFNGYAVDANGNASKELFGQYGIRRNRFYTLDWAGQLDMTQDWVKNMSGLHDDYAQGQLFAARLNPVFDEAQAGIHQGLQSPTYLVANSQERLEGIMSTFMKVGERNGSTGAWSALSDPEARREVEEQLELYTIKGGKLEKAAAATTLQEKIAHATKMDVNESAARMVREDSYDKAIKFDQLYNKLSAFSETKNKPATNQKRKDVLKSVMDNQSLILSKQVAGGKTINLSYSDVQQILGFKSGGDHKLFRETLDKYTTSFDYLEAQRGVSMQISNFIEGTHKNATREEKQFRYEQTMNALKGKAAKELANGSPELLARYLKDDVGSMVFAKDTNYFNLDMSGFYRDKDYHDIGYALDTNKADDILRINLAANREYGFVDELMRKSTKLTSWTPEQRNIHGTNVLRRFVDHVREQNQHPGLFKGFTDDFMKKFQSADVFAESIQREFVRYRGTDAGRTAGYITDLTIQNVLEGNAAFAHLEQDPAKLAASIKDINSKLPNLKFVNDMSSNEQTLRTHVESIVDNILMDDLKVNGKSVAAVDYAKHYGFDDVQAKTWDRVYQLTKEAHIEGITKFTKGLLQTDAKLAYDTQQKTLAVMMNGQSIALNNLPRIRATDGVLYAEVGSNRVGVHAKLDGSKYRKNAAGRKPDIMFDRGKINVVSTLKQAYQDTFDPIRAFRRGHENGNVMEQVKSYVAQFAEKVRAGSAMTHMDIADAFTTMRYDYSDLVDMLPYMHKAGMLNGVQFRDEGLMKIAQKKNLSFSGMSAVERETIQKNIPMLLKIASGMPVDGDHTAYNDLQFFAKNVSFTNKETQVAEYVGQVGGFTPKAGWQFDNNSRPPITQTTRAVMYRESDWQRGIANMGGREISIGSIFENGAAGLAHRNVDGLRAGDARTQVQLRMGKVNMAHAEFQAMIQKDYITKKALVTPAERERMEAVYSRMRNINLTEQEKLIDTRVMDNFFFRMDEQKINARKELALNLEANMQTLKQVQDLSSVVPVMQIKNGKVTFEYQKGRTVNRMDPVLNVVGFGDVEQTYGSKFNLGKFKFGYFTKTGGMLASAEDIRETLTGVRDEAEAYKRLESKYDAAFYVKNMEQLSYKKLANGFVEKDMAYSPYFGLGKLDKRVGQYLDHAGLGKFKGLALTEEAMNEDIYGSFRTNGIFKTKDELRAAITSERHAVFDTVRGIFSKNGIKDVSMVANHHIEKHGNVMLAFEEAVSTMVQLERRSDKALDENSAVGRVFKKLQDSKVMNIGGIAFKDGKIVMPNVLDGGVDNIDVAAMKGLISSDSLYKNNMMFDGRTGVGVHSSDGRLIGTYANTVVSEASDFQGMTTSGTFEKLSNLREKMRNGGGASDSVLEREYTQTYNAISRGKKITDREMQLLNLQRYDQGYIDVLQQGVDSGLMSKGEFENMMGHVLKKDEAGSFVKDGERYLIDEKVKGRSVLSEYTGSLRSRMWHNPIDGSDGRLTEDHISRSQIYDDNVKGDLRKILAHQEGKGQAIGIAKAEQLYSLGKGLQAMEWNAGGINDMKHMTDRGFRSVDLKDVATSIGQDASHILQNDANIFNKNLMIDMGEYAQSGKRHMAVPFAPIRRGGEDGENMIKYEFQKQINKIMSRRKDIDDIMTGRMEGDKTVAIGKFRDSISEFNSILGENMTGKYGIVGDIASVREKFAVNGKSSFATIIDPERMRNFKENGGFSKALVDDLATGTMQTLNEKSLGLATFQGKSLLEHYSKGSNVDARFVSEEAFERMGFFSDSYMASAGAANRDTMRQMLQTKGVMTDTTRYPTIKEGSTKPMMMYLSDDLAGNRTKLTAAGALAAVADNDGDLIASSVMRDRGGRDSLQAEASKSISDNYWKEANSMISYRALGVNQFWGNEVHKLMQEDIKNSINNGDFGTISGSKAIDGKIYAEYAMSPSADKINSNRQVYDQFMSMNPKLDDTSKTFIEDADKALQAIGNEADRNKYKNALIFENAFARNEVGQIAKARKLTIGEANIPLFRLRKATELAIGAMDETSEQRRNIVQQTAEVIEQEVISAKKGNVRQYVDKTEQFNNALNGLLYGSDQTRADSRKNMQDWLRTNAHKELAAEGQKLYAKNKDYFDGSAGEDAFQKMSNTFVDTLASFNPQQIRQLRYADSLGSGARGLAGENVARLRENLPADRGLMQDEVFDALRGSGLMDAQLRDRKEYEASFRALSDSGIQISDGRGWTQNPSTTDEIKGMLKKAGSAFGEMLGKADGKTLAYGALGLAGAYMVAGFVGGNPSRPAETHAYEDSASMSSGGGTPSLADQEMQAATPGRAGYVVNIRGGSPRGQQHAQNAMHNAISNSTSTNVNIAMNITNNGGNINDRYVENLLAGAIG